MAHLQVLAAIVEHRWLRVPLFAVFAASLWQPPTLMFVRAAVSLFNRQPFFVLRVVLNVNKL